VISTRTRLTHSRPDIIHPRDRLAGLGVDSLTKVEVVDEIEARFGFRVDDAIAGSLSVQDLRDLARAERAVSVGQG
jgi:acyl carrier protein